MACVSSDILAGTAPGHLLGRNGPVAAILSLDGHPLVMPRRHVPALDGLDEAEAASLMPMAVRIARALRAATGCAGVNLVLSDGAAAGQDVDHLHLHVKPRWPGDGVALEWNTATRPDEERARLADALRAPL